MLPSIQSIAESYQVEVNPNTYGKREMMCRCPFCDSRKYHLSLNTEKHVFKCWRCKKSGGAIKFESLLSNEPFQKVREKYFGKKKKSLHPAYDLSPDQLREIGWYDKRRENFHDFKKSRSEVLKDWEIYKYEELTKYFALYTLINHFPAMRKDDFHTWFDNICKTSKIDDLAGVIKSEWDNPKGGKWAEKGKEIARVAYLSSKEGGDLEFRSLFVNVLITIELLKIKKIQANQNTVS